MAYSAQARRGKARATRVAFRLNPKHPREKVIYDFLDSLKDQYRASGAAKRALYQMITGCDWDSGQPLVAAQAFVGTEETLPPHKDRDQEAERQQLDNILAGFADWETQYTSPVALAGH